MVEVDLQIATRETDVPQLEKVIVWVETALNTAGYQNPAELTVRLVDEEESRTLNATYRHKDAPTNILSFPFECEEGLDIPLLGDMVICVPVLLQEAATQGILPEAHWAHLVIHGTLHLLGFDHQDEDEALEMETLETEALACLGMDDPYRTE
jgi:probable rRNA maturation factor